MSKNKDYLVLVGSLEEILHFGDFSQNWWETRQDINSNDVGSVSILYPIRIRKHQLFSMEQNFLLLLFKVVKVHHTNLDILYM